MLRREGMDLRSVCNAGVYGVWGFIDHRSVGNAGVGCILFRVV